MQIRRHRPNRDRWHQGDAVVTFAREAEKRDIDSLYWPQLETSG